MITRDQGGEGLLDEVTFEVTWPDPEEIYFGCCSISARASQRTTTGGLEELAVGEYYLKLPARTMGIRVGDEVTLTAADDPALLDRLFVVKRFVEGTHSITRRVVVTDSEAVPTTGSPE